MEEKDRLKDKYIDPFTDFGFKKLLGEECNKDLLVDFLNELLHKKEGKIVNLTFFVTSFYRTVVIFFAEFSNMTKKYF